MHQILNQSNGDHDISTIIFQILVCLFAHDKKKNTHKASISLRICGEKLIQDIIAVHKDDETIRLSGKAITKGLTEGFIATSLEKIDRVKKAFELGMSNYAYEKAFHQLSNQNNQLGNQSDEGAIIVLSEMKQHLDHEGVLANGLELLDRMLRDDADHTSEFLSCDSLCTIFITAQTIPVKQNYHIQRLSLTMLLRLTVDLRLRQKLYDEDNFSTLIRLLFDNAETMHFQLRQVLLWILNNLVVEGNVKK